MKSAIQTSLLVHIAVLFMLAGGFKCGKGTGNTGTDGAFDKDAEKRNVIEKDKTVQIEIEEPQEGFSKKKKPKPKPSEEACGEGKYYGGIGVLLHGRRTPTGELTITIGEVYKGYPADKIGILPGDRVLNDNLEFKGKPGTEVKIYIERDGVQQVFIVLREKICVDDTGPDSVL